MINAPSRVLAQVGSGLTSVRRCASVASWAGEFIRQRQRAGCRNDSELVQARELEPLLAGAVGACYLRVMRTYTAVVERDADTGLYVGYVPGWPGAHSQGATEDELRENLREVIAMLLEDGEPVLQAEFVGTQTVQVA